jgi:hypothetical protein
MGMDLSRWEREEGGISSKEGRSGVRAESGKSPVQVMMQDSESYTRSVEGENGSPEVARAPRYSTTPKRLMHGRTSLSTTPKAGDISVSTVTGLSPRGPEVEDWGDGAMLQWDGHRDDGEDDVSSVAPDDAGVEGGEYGGEEDEDWGAGAVMDWQWHEDGDGLVEGGDQVLTISSDNSPGEDAVESEESEEEIEEIEEKGEASAGAHEVESTTDLLARGMPDYATWEIKKLQVSYGLKDIYTERKLIQIASNRGVWLSTHHQTICLDRYRHSMLACCKPPSSTTWPTKTITLHVRFIRGCATGQNGEIKSQVDGKIKCEGQG